MESNPHIAREIRRLEEQYSFRPDSLVFGRLAELHRKAGEPERALEILEQGLSRHPRYLSARIVRARCLRAVDRPERAREAFEDVLRLDDENPVALRSLAELALERGDRDGARRHLEALLRARPGDDESRAMLAELEEEAREEEAREEEELRPERSEEVPAADPEEAAELREQVEELDLSSPTAEEGEEDLATETLAGLYETQGFYREAVQMYERLLEERPEAEEIRQRLERARAALREADGGSGDAPEEGGGGTDEAAAAVAYGDEGPAVEETESAAEHLRALLRGEARRSEVGGGG